MAAIRYLSILLRPPSYLAAIRIVSALVPSEVAHNDLRRLCHFCHYYHSTATAATPATLLPLLQSLPLYCPAAIRIISAYVLSISPRTTLCAHNDLRLLCYSPLHTSYASTIILATTIILAIVLFNHAKCNHACATCHCGIKPVARNCYVVFPILISQDIATQFEHYSAQLQLTTTRLLCRMPSSPSYLCQS